MELLIITALIIIAWAMADRAGRARINEAAAADDRPAAYSALGCNLVWGLLMLALMLFVVFGLAGAPRAH